MTTANWYVLRVKPHKERPVYRLLKAREVEVFFPSVKVNPVNPRAARERPFFPGYMFVRADLAEVGQNAFSWLPGVQGLVRFGEQPAMVPENLIHEIRRRLAEIKQAGGLALDGLEKGDRVRIVGGPFAGYEAIFDLRLPGQERVQVLLAFLSRYPQPIKLHPAHIEKIAKKKGNQ
jgi:transcription antitermination factor NusG